MSERLAFVQACLNRRERIIDICDRFGISEKTGHKYLRRFQREGVAGLVDRSHAPRVAAHRMSAAVEAQIVELRRRHPDYGPEKLRDWLRNHHPTSHWPASSSIGALLKRAGLIPARRRRPRAHLELHAGPLTASTEPNEVWTADFKGEFRLTTGSYCHPLTVLDLFSHFSLDCAALAATALAPTRQRFEELFREYGLPKVIRSDNGVPFAQPNALGRLGALAFWWVRLGIRPEHTRPAHPAENGAHERFHKTLKAAATRPASASLRAQQRRFDQFRQDYNEHRPHSSLQGHVAPASVYRASPRSYPDRLAPLIYPPTSLVRLVSTSGTIKWHDHPLHLSKNLAGEYVGLAETAAGLYTITYGPLALGELDPHLVRFTARVRWEG